MKIKWILYGLIAAVAIGFNFCGGNNTEEYTTEEVVTPTQGLVTTVKEVDKDIFKIEDEQAIDDQTASRIIAKYMDNTVDTFSLEEAKMMASDSSSTSTTTHHRRSSVMRMASYGLMGYYMGRNMGTYRPNSSAYVDQNTYSRVTNNAGQSLNRTANRTTVSRPKSGFGSTSRSGSSTRSTRSYGG